MIDTRPVVQAISKVAIAMGVLMLAPAVLDWSRGSDTWQVFAATSAGTVILAGLVMVATRHEHDTLTLEQAFLLTSGLWLILPIIGAVPILMGVPQADWTAAIFESMSGMSTTGTTAFPDLDIIDHGVHLWRAILQWIGGLGIVVVAMIFLPVMRVGGMQFFRSEGFDTQGKVMPRAGSIATEITQLYIGITVLCALAYAATGMHGLDAIIHAMTTCSTGGFSNYNSSLGGFSAPIQAVTVIFTILASIPFVRMLQAMHGQLMPIWTDSQIRAYLGFIATICLLILIYEALWMGHSPTPTLAGNVVFNVVTVISGTGFSTVDVTQWGHLPFVLLIVVGLVGGCTGSTVCSIKVFRYQVVFQALRAQLAQMQSPHRVRLLTLQGRRLDPDVVNSVIAFFTLFILSLGVLIVALALTGLHARTALTAAWTSLANIGPIWGPEVSTNGSVADFPPSAKWLMIAGMYLGRLELITVFVVLMPRFWRQ